MKRVVTALLLGASLCGTASGQVEPSRGGSAGIGFGIQVDLRSLVSGVAALFGHATSDTASNVVAGQVVAVWAEDEVALAPEEVARAMQARVLADHPLSSLGLRLVLFAVDEEEADKLLAQARQSFPQITFARNSYVDTLQTEHTAASPGAAGRQYAHELVGATAVQRLPQPVRIGVIDGAPDANTPLDAASFDLQRFTDAGHSPHASAIACELACRPETGFPGLARGAELLWAAILSPHQNGHERSDLVTLARALDGLVKRRAEVILTSLGTPPNPVLTRVLDRVLPKVRAFVAAAGNGGPNGTVPLPAAHPGVVGRGRRRCRRPALAAGESRPGHPRRCARRGPVAPRRRWPVFHRHFLCRAVRRSLDRTAARTRPVRRCGCLVRHGPGLAARWA
jgi:hypothetical protein